MKWPVLCLHFLSLSATSSARTHPDEVIAESPAALKSLRKTRNLEPACELGSGPALFVSSVVGSDDNDGSTTTSPLATIQQAVNLHSPCSTIFVMTGVYQNELYGQGIHHSNAVVNLSGVTDGLTITNYNEDRPLLQFDGPAGIVCQSSNPCAHLRIAGIEIEGQNGQISYTDAMQHRLVTHNRYTGKGIAVWSGHHIVIEDVTVHDCPGSGIRVNKGDYITVADSTVYNNCWWSRSAESAIVFAESLAVDTSTDTKMFMVRNLVYGNMNKIPYYNPSYAWDYSPIGNLPCGDYPACNGGNPQECPWQCRYGKSTQDYIIDGMGVYVTRNKDTYLYGRMELSNNIAYGNGINGLVFHRTNRGSVVGNLIYDNGKVPVDSHVEPVVEDWHASTSGKGRQPYSGLVINNAEEVELFDNKVSSRFSDDYAFIQEFDGAVVPLAAGGNNVACKGVVQMDPASAVTTTTDQSICSCTVCTDEATPWAIANNQDCASWEWGLSNKCNQDTNWINSNYCQASCFANGKGYAGDVCCPAPTPQPTPSPTVSPTASPSASPTSCTPCTDDPTSWMLDNGKTCDSWTYGITNNCNANPSWVDSKPCQYSCFLAGNGYPDDFCCPPTPNPTTSPTSTPTTASPTVTPCTACTDERTQWMETNGKMCDSWSYGISNNCNQNDNWVSAKTCQASCYAAGKGYAGDVCC